MGRPNDNHPMIDDPRLPDRFWSKVSPCPMSGCWIWTAGLTTYGYGTFGWRWRQGAMAAHLVAYRALVGEPTTGLTLDHLCRTRCCVNPAHLEQVSRGENVRRGEAGRATGAKQRAKTHCPHGHEYAGENLYVTKVGARQCKTCNRNRYHHGRTGKVLAEWDGPTTTIR